MKEYNAIMNSVRMGFDRGFEIEFKNIIFLIIKFDTDSVNTNM